MKHTFRILLIASLVMIASLGSALAAPPPFKKACNDLERAHSIVTALQEGGKGGIGKSKATLPNLVTALSDAEVSLNEAKEGKGTNRNVALHFIAQAKKTLEAAQGRASSDQLADVKQAIKEALKRVAK
jgi:hypothetical protein